MISLKKAGFSISSIDTQLKRSRTVVSAFLKNPSTYKTQNFRSNRRKITTRDGRSLLWAASSSNESACTLRNELKHPISFSRTRAYLSGSAFLHYKKIKTQPMLLQIHGDARIKFAMSHSNKYEEWCARVVWCDEKPFNCDLSDGLKCYWRKLRRGELVLSGKKYGGNGVMV